MHPVLSSSKAGRAGSPINYGLREHVMPPPPPHPKAIHDLVNLESTADPLGKRPAKWNKSTSADVFRKFSREKSHLRLDNVCTMENYFNDPDTKCLQCWYFPRPPKRAKNPETPAKLFKAMKPDQLTARQDMWGAWNVSTVVETPRTKGRILKGSTTDAQTNSKHYFEKHVDTITALRELHKRGDKPCKESGMRINHLRKRKEDIEAVLNLPSIG